MFWKIDLFNQLPKSSFCFCFCCLWTTNTHRPSVYLSIHLVIHPARHLRHCLNKTWGSPVNINQSVSISCQTIRDTPQNYIIQPTHYSPTTRVCISGRWKWCRNCIFHYNYTVHRTRGTLFAVALNKPPNRQTADEVNIRKWAEAATEAVTSANP